MTNIKNKYSKEEIIEQLRDYYTKNPDMNSRSYGRDKKTCSRSTIRIMFGSWGNALEEAGITAKGVAPFFPKKVTKYEFSPIKIVVSNIRLYHYFYDLIEPAYFLYYLI